LATSLDGIWRPASRVTRLI